MISSNLFPGWADAGQRVDSSWYQPYLPFGFWNGYLIGSNPYQVPPMGCEAFGYLSRTHNSQHCLATVPFPVTTSCPNHIPPSIGKAVPVRRPAQREVRLLELLMQAIDHQRDGMAMTVDIYHWLEQYDPVRFPSHNSGLWRNQVRGCLSNRCDLFVKTDKKGRKYNSGRIVRGHYWCRKSAQSTPGGRPVTVPVSQSASVVTPALMPPTAMTSTHSDAPPTAATSTISDAGQASTTSQTR